MAAGDGVRDANQKRNVARAQSKARQKALAAAEQREIEANRELQESLKQAYYERHPDKRLAA